MVGNSFSKLTFNLKALANTLALFTVILLGLGFLQENSVKVKLFWMTADQSDIAGFDIFRAGEMNGTYAQLNLNLIPVQGDRLFGARYEFVDKEVQPGMKYYYRIESVSSSGQREIAATVVEQTKHNGLTAFILGGIFSITSIIALITERRLRSKSVED